MQKNFQYAEIGVAQFCPLDAPGGRAETAPETLSKKRARHAGRWNLALEASFSASFQSYLDIKYIYIKILSIDQIT